MRLAPEPVGGCGAGVGRNRRRGLLGLTRAGLGCLGALLGLGHRRGTSAALALELGANAPELLVGVLAGACGGGPLARLGRCLSLGPLALDRLAQPAVGLRLHPLLGFGRRCLAGGGEALLDVRGRGLDLRPRALLGLLDPRLGLAPGSLGLGLGCLEPAFALGNRGRRLLVRRGFEPGRFHLEMAVGLGPQPLRLVGKSPLGGVNALGRLDGALFDLGQAAVGVLDQPDLLLALTLELELTLRELLGEAVLGCLAGDGHLGPDPLLGLGLDPLEPLGGGSLGARSGRARSSSCSRAAALRAISASITAPGLGPRLLDERRRSRLGLLGRLGAGATRRGLDRLTAASARARSSWRRRPSVSDSRSAS